MRKIILLSLLLLSCISIAQDLKIKIDDFTGTKIITCSAQKENALISTSIAEEYLTDLRFIGIISKNNIVKKYLSLTTTTNKILCFQKKDCKIIILFENGDKINLDQSSDLTCNTTTSNLYELYENYNVDLLNKKISKIRVYHTEGYFDLTIKNKKKDLIIDTILKFNMSF